MWENTHNDGICKDLGQLPNRLTHLAGVELASTKRHEARAATGDQIPFTGKPEDQIGAIHIARCDEWHHRRTRHLVDQVGDEIGGARHPRCRGLVAATAVEDTRKDLTPGDLNRSTGWQRGLVRLHRQIDTR